MGDEIGLAHGDYNLERSRKHSSESRGDNDFKGEGDLPVLVQMRAIGRSISPTVRRYAEIGDSAGGLVFQHRKRKAKGRKGKKDLRKKVRKGRGCGVFFSTGRLYTPRKKFRGPLRNIEIKGWGRAAGGKRTQRLHVSTA